MVLVITITSHKFKVREKVIAKFDRILSEFVIYSFRNIFSNKVFKLSLKFFLWNVKDPLTCETLTMKREHSR